MYTKAKTKHIYIIRITATPLLRISKLDVYRYRTYQNSQNCCSLFMFYKLTPSAPPPQKYFFFVVYLSMIVVPTSIYSVVVRRIYISELKSFNIILYSLWRALLLILRAFVNCRLSKAI